MRLHIHTQAFVSESHHESFFQHHVQNTSGRKTRWKPTVLAENAQVRLSVDPDKGACYHGLHQQLDRVDVDSAPQQTLTPFLP
jgi:hypothetical protein